MKPKASDMVTNPRFMTGVTKLMTELYGEALPWAIVVRGDDGIGVTGRMKTPQEAVGLLEEGLKRISGSAPTHAYNKEGDQTAPPQADSLAAVGKIFKQ